jgi:hypothetical protein
MSDKPVAVHFNSYEEAKIFYEEMKANYPDRVGGWDKVIYTAGDERSSGVCYCPYFSHKDGSMTYGSREAYDMRGIRVIEFYELLYDDSTEIVESVLPFEFLLN